MEIKKELKLTLTETEREALHTTKIIIDFLTDLDEENCEQFAEQLASQGVDCDEVTRERMCTCYYVLRALCKFMEIGDE